MTLGPPRRVLSPADASAPPPQPQGELRCHICNEPSERICKRCTRDACENHLCERCGRCSDCCECA